MKIYCMSDIHGCLAEFEEALNRIGDCLEREDTRLVLLGDYIHGREDGRYVLDKIMKLQYKYGRDKVIALMGNHEEFVLLGYSTIAEMNPTYSEEQEADDDKYIRWIENLPRYYTEGNTIFVHAGIDEEAGDLWEWGTGEETFVGKFPAQTGKIEGLESGGIAV